MGATMLLRKVDRARLPELGVQDGLGDEAVAYVKFFGGGRWTWFVTEYDGDDTMFGLVVSGLGPDCDELTYFELSALKALRFPPFGLPIERDRHFEPTTLGKIRNGGS